MLKVRKRKYKSGKEAWYADFIVRGKRYRSVLEANNKAQAIQMARKLQDDVISERYELSEKSQKTTLRELSDKYIEFAKETKKSWDRDVVSLNNILNMIVDDKKLGDYNIDEITPEHILKYQTRRKRELDEKFESKAIEKRDRNFATINRELACLKHIYYLAVDWEIVEKNPVARKSIKFFKEKRRERILSKDEMATLLKAADGHTYQIICIGLNTGMRLGEILNLRWDNIDLQNRRISVIHTKTDENRDIPMNEFLFEILTKIRKKTQYLFLNRQGKPIKSIKTAFRNVLRRSGINDFRFHDLRHTFSSYLAMEGIDENTRSELLGHKKSSMTSTYTHSSWEQKKKAVQIIGNFCHVFVTRDAKS